MQVRRKTITSTYSVVLSRLPLGSSLLNEATITPKANKSETSTNDVQSDFAMKTRTTRRCGFAYA